MGETFAEFGDLVFTVVIGYISAIEFLYVVRHLYHHAFNHDANEGVGDGENLSQLQDSMRQQLVNAKNREAMAGTQVMKDGVPYKDGFRLEAQQALIEQLKEQLKHKELSDLKRKELEKELAAQMKIAEKLRKELAEAEAKYQRHLKQEEEAKAKKLLEEQRKREVSERKQREEQERKEAEEQARKLAETEKLRELEQRQREEAEENIRRLQEAEKQREAEQRNREENERYKKEIEQKERERIQREEQERKEAEENIRRLQEAEKQRENEQRKLEEEQEQASLEAKRQKQVELQNKEQEMAEAEENARRLLAIEKTREEKQAAAEAAEAELDARNLLEIEHRLEEQLRAAEKEAELTEKERQLIDSIKERKERDLSDEEGSEHKEAELLRKILQAREQLGEESEEEQSFRLIQRERDRESKQKRIEENALLFMEAEKEMADLQSKMFDAVERRQFSGNLDSAPHTPVLEEPCIKRSFTPLSGSESTHSTVKTQLAQDLDEPYSVRTKPLLFPGVSDDASSIDPASSLQSSFSTQLSEDILTGNDSQYPPQQRQEPDGEDTALTNMQYTDDYLRSLDGIKQRPLMREDGSGRRRAFKKRRSSNSSNSSRESRHSRDEELKMFTSLEEEEMKDTADSEFTPIRYTTEPTLKVKNHHRRHKRSPAKDMRRGDDSSRSSLERLGEETSDPWGEIKPEQYKNTEFWKREKNVSIDEEIEFEKPGSSEEVTYDTATNMPSASSFEEATQKQNQEALTALQKHSAHRSAQQEKLDDQDATKDQESARSDNTNLQTSQAVEKAASPARSTVKPRLQRSPGIEEIDQYEENRQEIKVVTDKSVISSAQNTPTINVQTPLDFAPWRDEHGLMMEGLSDFYDFTASINPSRSASRNVSPANTAPNTPLPKNVSKKEINEKATVEIYDDTQDLKSNEFKKENIERFIDSLNGNEDNAAEESIENIVFQTDIGIKNHLQYVADDHHSKELSNQVSLVPLVNIINAASNVEDTESGDAARSTLGPSSRSPETHRARSRSKSPLPTSDNLKRSVENRRYKMIKHNEDILEKLIESKLLPELTPQDSPEASPTVEKNQTVKLNVATDNENKSQEEMKCLEPSLHVETRRSRSKSPMRLPTVENLSKGLEKRRTKLIERNDELIKQLEERSQTPESPTIIVKNVYEIESAEDTQSATLTFNDSPQYKEPLSPTGEEEDDCSREQMDLLVQSLRAARSKTRSKSPMCVKDIENLNEISNTKTFYGFQHVETTQRWESVNVPTISIDFPEAENESKSPPKVEDADDYSREKMDLLVQSLRIARSRSTSKSPMRSNDEKVMQHMEERCKTPEPFSITKDYVCEEKVVVDQRSRHSRSRSPSRSHSRSLESAAAFCSKTSSTSPSPQYKEYDDFDVMYSCSTEEQEFLLSSLNRQRQLDEEALKKLRNSFEEVELRTSPALALDKDELNERYSRDYLSELPVTERSKLLKISPTTPDYDRTISEEMRDVDRIKQERLAKGFKRSTYVGESMDLGSEFEPLRRETAKFQRSRSPSPSVSTIESATAQRNAEEKRKIQEMILQELIISKTTGNRDSKERKITGAIPKTERLSSCEIELSLNNETEDIKIIKEKVLSSSIQISSNAEQLLEKTENFEEMRRRNADFRRSASTSRSPLRESQLEELAGIEAEAAKRVRNDKFLDKVSCSSSNLKDFSHQLNTGFFDNDRRASDTALTKVPKILVHHNEDIDLDPEEYHHYRRFSLAQEEPVEQYPGDDYIFIQQVEVRTRSGSRTWLREDFYSENVDEYLAKSEKSKETATEGENAESANNEEHQEEENIPIADDDEEYSNASDDDRQTVVEVDDEIDEDISDFNERGPAEESHHETSECEEAEREMDRYADREASDWNRAVDVDVGYRVNERINREEEGAVGGSSSSPYDSDSFAIDQIYDEAIKNRKQSGILREYDSILMQMSTNSDIDEQYMLWSKTNGKKNPKNIEFNTQFIDSERKDFEMRYLGDANISSRQSARLRSRYGYNPVLQAKCIDDDDLQVDLNYKPKREYNWRKNFKLDEDVVKEDREITLAEICSREEKDNNVAEEQWEENKMQTIEERTFSLEGESVTLFSCSPEKSMALVEDRCELRQELTNETLGKEALKKEKVEKVEKLEKSKKKKTKKKPNKETKASLEETMNREDEDAYDNQVYQRRSSSIHMDTDSPKRKSRSRRSSKSSLANEDSLGLFSPRSSVAYNEAIADIMEESTDVAKETARPKKMKKRKKVKETMAHVAETPIESKEEFQYIMAPLNDIPAASTAITPESYNANILSTLSTQNSVCVTPASSIDMDVSVSVEELRESCIETTATASSSTTASSPSGNLSRTSSITTNISAVDSFDILKDANFYPLF